ncbi:hypothetical protein Q1695_005709 [Nippostrongylus brasiliensis]|nr:hypothetical protein Q1695_005709 [Nippostrongylus brasiliensis]
MARAALGMSFALASRQSVLRTSNCQAWRSCGKIVSDCKRPEETSCWNCKDAVECTKQFFCDSCHTIQPPPDSQNLFEYMGLPVTYRIKDSALKKRFRELQFNLHPDKFAQASEQEKKLSDEHARRLNESYKTLSEPLLRAKYLLKILGGEETNGLDLDESSLLEMMEWRERVAEMSTSTELRAEAEAVQKEIDVLLGELDKLFERKDLDAVRVNITKLSYLYSLSKQIDDRLETMRISEVE